MGRKMGGSGFDSHIRMIREHAAAPLWFDSTTIHQKVSPTHRMVRATWEDSGAGGSLAKSRDG
jgi:hypothetical protein